MCTKSTIQIVQKVYSFHFCFQKPSRFVNVFLWDCLKRHLPKCIFAKSFDLSACFQIWKVWWKLSQLYEINGQFPQFFTSCPKIFFTTPLILLRDHFWVLTACCEPLCKSEGIFPSIMYWKAKKRGDATTQKPNKKLEGRSSKWVHQLC